MYVLYSTTVNQKAGQIGKYYWQLVSDARLALT